MNRNQDIEEKAVVDQHNGHEPLKETTHEAAERGHVATDIYGNALITFDPQEEKRLRRKIDIYIIPTVFLLYLFAFIDRANIGNARLAGFEEDLGMDPESFDFSTVLSMFYVSYIIFEIPANVSSLQAARLHLRHKRILVAAASILPRYDCVSHANRKTLDGLQGDRAWMVHSSNNTRLWNIISRYRIRTEYGWGLWCAIVRGNLVDVVPDTVTDQTRLA